MTGTVHDRAIAEELRNWADRITKHWEYAPNRVAGYLWECADELEAAAPPATIDAAAEAETAPEGTVLALRKIIIVKRPTGWMMDGIGSVAANPPINEPWSVLRWGYGDE